MLHLPSRTLVKRNLSRAVLSVLQDLIACLEDGNEEMFTDT
ncbi:hypothetical protein ANCCAN_29440, partial [Ancylostoma caninum]